MEEEAADEFLGVKGHRFQAIFVFSIPVGEGDLAVFEFEDAVVGERHPVRIATEVIEDFVWGRERLFRIEDPVCIAEPRSRGGGLPWWMAFLIQ